MGQVVELDVREHLRKKLEPFKIIMDKVNSLAKEDTFILHATFKPTPLLGVMKTKGFVNKVEKLAADHWIITFVNKSRAHELLQEGDPALADDDASAKEGSATKAAAKSESPESPMVYELDNRGLEPPQPMIRTLNKLDKARPGDRVVIHNDRVPMFLIEELNTLGYPYDVDNQPDGSAIVVIEKK